MGDFISSKNFTEKLIYNWFSIKSNLKNLKFKFCIQPTFFFKNCYRSILCHWLILPWFRIKNLIIFQCLSHLQWLTGNQAILCDSIHLYNAVVLMAIGLNVDRLICSTKRYRDDPGNQNFMSIPFPLNVMRQNYILLFYKMVLKLPTVATGDFRSNFVPKRVRKIVGLRNGKPS